MFRADRELLLDETKSAETLLQPSKMALAKILSCGFWTSHELWKKFTLQKAELMVAKE